MNGPELVEDMRRQAVSCREVGDSYDEGGNAEQAHYHWGIAEGYMRAVAMIDRALANGTAR